MNTRFFLVSTLFLTTDKRRKTAERQLPPPPPPQDGRRLPLSPGSLFFGQRRSARVFPLSFFSYHPPATRGIEQSFPPSHVDPSITNETGRDLPFFSLFFSYSEVGGALDQDILSSSPCCFTSSFTFAPTSGYELFPPPLYRSH